jgi:hypothetical protein
MTRAALATALLLLAGCGGKNDDAARKDAAGKILPGSASDAMIDYAALRSQPPLAPRTEASGKPGAKGEAKGAAAPEAGTASEAAPSAGAAEPAEPVATPAAE